MKKKRIAAIALSMAVAAGLVACGGGQAADGTTAAGTTGSAEAGTGTDGNGNTVIVAMGSGFSTLDPGHVYGNIHSLLPMPAMKIFLSFMRTTEPRSHVWLILMSFLMAV